MEVYIIRHGETDYNLKGIVQGRGVNSSLNDTGQKQAAAFFERYREIPFDRVYISTLQRTRQSVERFISAGIPHEAHDALDEIDWGIYEGIENAPEMHERYLSIIEQWRRGNLDLKIDGGESAADLRDRIGQFVKHLDEVPFSRVLVCSHGRSIRALLCCLTGKDLSLMDDFPHTNTTLYKLRRQDGRYAIEIFNNTDHLNGVL